MHYTSALSALVAGLATVNAQSTTCHSYVIISIRGTYELQGRSIAFTSMINDTFAAIPGGIEYDAVYPAAVNQTAYLGADDVTRYITTGLQSCPSQKYAILGYSQGASATMLTLANITDSSTPIYNAIKAVLVVGNPYHVPNATLNIDEFGGSSTRKYPGATYNANNASTRGIPEIYYQNGKLLDICHTEDIVCAPGYPNSSFSPGHLHYGDANVQTLGKNFLIEKLGMNGTSSGGGSANATASAMPAAYTGAASNVQSRSIVGAVIVVLLSGVLATML
ncbi:carbohydrate esterase family 5 protein [Dothistroma septosporum NZE10]|uniref:Carbohydrate esterase family 5 protein n=1 Tax=Dothistroma septosporum (strain NZE10 / CBS 128990) TaxID=675120 RepID=N1PU29_DOTSN|nr:carbohydrate esterase family 5 protein [Dothistroma septosporum NZE10]